MKIEININQQVWVKMEGRAPELVIDKKQPEFAVRRASQYSFFYKDKLYDMKGKVIKPECSKAYRKYLNATR